VKFFYVIVSFVIAVLFNQLIPLLVLFFIQIPFVLAGKVVREWLRSLRGAVVLVAFIFVFNFIFNYFYQIYTGWTLVEFSFSMAVRFIVLMESFSIFFLTTSPDHLSLALEQSHVPYEFTFAFTTAVRFVPVLAEEAQTIMDAQKARGLELERGNFLKRVRNYIPILIPLIVSAIRRSLELAEAMESRAWGANPKHTNLYILQMKKADFALITISIIFLILGVYIYFYYYSSIPTLAQLLSK
jgi:energy-coupling factor transport system permease protein